MSQPPTEPSVPLMIDAPLPGAHNPTRWTVQFGIRITVALCIVAALLGALAAYEAISYARSTNAAQQRTNARLIALERAINDRRAQRDQERDEILAKVDADRLAGRINSCALLQQLSTDKSIGPAIARFYELAKCDDIVSRETPAPTPSP